MTIHEELVSQFETYLVESKRFEEKGIKASGMRARKALAEIAKLCKERKKEIQEAIIQIIFLHFQRQHVMAIRLMVGNLVHLQELGVVHHHMVQERL